jgi:ParB-like chromosome segregation protein Spo0J
VKIQSVGIDTVHADPSNARMHPDRNLEAIKASLARFGQQKPIVVDANGIVRAGNGTLEAARALGWVKIAIVRTSLENSEATAFSIADNRTSELAAWDESTLGATLQALQLEEFDLGSVGFTEDEIAALIRRADEEAGSGVPADFPEKDESIETDYCCPKCGYTWSGKPA